MPHRFAARALLAAVALAATGCAGEKTWYRPWGTSPSTPKPTKAAKLVPSYQGQLDIHSRVELTQIGRPVAHVTVTNIGDRNVNYLKFVAVADSAIDRMDYHDVRVLKPLTAPTGETTLLSRDGGTTSFLVEFKPWEPGAGRALTPRDVKVDVRLTEIGFTK